MELMPTNQSDNKNDYSKAVPLVHLGRKTGIAKTGNTVNTLIPQLSFAKKESRNSVYL